MGIAPVFVIFFVIVCVGSIANVDSISKKYSLNSSGNTILGDEGQLYFQVNPSGDQDHLVYMSSVFDIQQETTFQVIDGNTSEIGGVSVDSSGIVTSIGLQSYSDELEAIYLLRYDTDFNLLKKRRFLFSGIHKPSGVVDVEGNLFIVGVSSEYEDRVFLLNIHGLNGTFQFLKHYYVPGADKLRSIPLIVVSDTGRYFNILIDVRIHNDRRTSLFTVDVEDGSLVNTQSFINLKNASVEGFGRVHCGSGSQTYECLYFCGGYETIGKSGFLVLLNGSSSNSTQIMKELKFPLLAKVDLVESSSDDGYILIGRSNDTTTRYIFQKLSPDFHFEWGREIEGEVGFNSTNKVFIQEWNGNFIFVGSVGHQSEGRFTVLSLSCNSTSSGESCISTSLEEKGLNDNYEPSIRSFSKPDISTELNFSVAEIPSSLVDEEDIPSSVCRITNTYSFSLTSLCTHCVSDEYSGDLCETFYCFGRTWEDEDVCSKHGWCVQPQTCDCFSSNYTGDECDDWDCFDINRKTRSWVCSGHGDCDDVDKCVCLTGYFGSECGSFNCWNISNDDHDNVCSGHGLCLSEDVCKCSDNGYSGLDCSFWDCGGYPHSSEEVCSSHGDCVSFGECICYEGYEGYRCETWSCGFDKNDIDQTCSGNGECVSPGICECKSGFSGSLCETNDLYIYVMLPVLLVSGFIGFLLVCFIICAVGVLVLCLLLFGFLLLFALLVIIVRQRLGMKNFKKLKNFDILLKEQELEEDTSIAHLRIKRNLFEVDYDEIEVDRIIGEGGSNSIVYLVSWKGNEAAFKCFKTRLVMETQDKFEEFEREVEIFASLSHPNIIQFFGASLKAPRVGILMEYCSNGELFTFLVGYMGKNSGKSYPLREKVRMAVEVASSVEYLHSRKIFHRDLKCENVLVSDKEICKLMDFGLSRTVERMSVKKTIRIGTNNYMAPEVLSGDYTDKCDVFSFGIMFWIMICENNKPYGQDDFSVEFRVSSDPNFRPSVPDLRKKILENTRNGGYNLRFLEKVIMRCWKHEPDERLSMGEVIKVIHKSMEKCKKEMKESGVKVKKNRITSIRSGRSAVRSSSDVFWLNTLDEGNEVAGKGLKREEEEEKVKLLNIRMKERAKILKKTRKKVIRYLGKIEKENEELSQMLEEMKDEESKSSDASSSERSSSTSFSDTGDYDSEDSVEIPSEEEGEEEETETEETE